MSASGVRHEPELAGVLEAAPGRPPVEPAPSLAETGGRTGGQCLNAFPGDAGMTLMRTFGPPQILPTGE
jgi:hypothetical protein